MAWTNVLKLFQQKIAQHFTKELCLPQSVAVAENKPDSLDENVAKHS